jgi:hypothetical protein
MSEIDIITADLIQLAHRFNSLGNISINALLKKSRYIEMYNQISEQDIREALFKHPECIDEWICYSEDKRSSKGWYLLQEKGNNFKVGFSPCGTDEYFSNRIDACAAFIKREAEDIRLTSGG